MKNKRCAFTLIELLITTAILAVISLAIYAMVSNGVKIWQKVNNQRIIEDDLDIFFEKFAHDLRNCVIFSGVKFVGTPDHLEFATIVNSPALQRNTVGQIQYVYDDKIQQLERIQRDYAQITSEEQGLSQPVLDGLKSCKFSYYIQNKNSKERSWLQESPVDVIPLAVRIELQLTNSDETSTFTRTVSIPVGG